MAILIGRIPRVSAIYDPIHHTVYSAILPGPEDHIAAGAEAEAWYVSTNSRLDLVRLSETCGAKDLREAAVGIHLTRSHPEKLKAFLGVKPRAAAPWSGSLQRAPPSTRSIPASYP